MGTARPPVRLTTGRYLQLVGLLVGMAVGFGQMSFLGRSTERVGGNQTTRFTRGIWFSPWYEEFERRTPKGVEESWFAVRVLSLSWPLLGVGIACFVLLIRLTTWPGTWVQEASDDNRPPRTEVRDA